MSNIESALMVVCALLAAGLLVLLALYVEARVKDVRRRERHAQQRLRSIGEDTPELDVVSAFENYQESVAEILDRDPVRREELIRDLQAATDVWERAEFDSAVKPLRRDLGFRLAVRRALRTKATT
jgi:hypothetical protein